MTAPFFINTIVILCYQSRKMTNVIIIMENLALPIGLQIDPRVNKIAMLSQPWESILYNSTNIYSL